MKIQRLMWIENKSAGSGLVGPARIGYVLFSKTGKTLYYRAGVFQSLKGDGFKANYYELESGDEYWISGCRKDGRDALYNTDVEVDEDAANEYWTGVRGRPDQIGVLRFRARGKY